MVLVLFACRSLLQFTHTRLSNPSSWVHYNCKLVSCLFLRLAWAIAMGWAGQADMVIQAVRSTLIKLMSAHQSNLCNVVVSLLTQM